MGDAVRIKEDSYYLPGELVYWEEGVISLTIPRKIIAIKGYAITSHILDMQTI